MTTVYFADGPLEGIEKQVESKRVPKRALFVVRDRKLIKSSDEVALDKASGLYTVEYFNVGGNRFSRSKS